MILPAVELITVPAAERAGITRRSLARAAEKGTLVHLRRGVYVEAAQWESLDPREQHRVALQALTEVAHRAVVVSHWSAALLHGLPVPRSRLQTLEVTVPPGSSRTFAGARAHADLLGEGAIEVVEGLWATTLLRTVLDVASSSPFAEGVMVADAALHRAARPDRGAVLGELRTLWSATPPRRSRTRVLDVLAFADGDAESPGESASRVTMHAIGLPKPVLQREFWDRRGFAGRSDFWFPEQDVIGEMDGRGKYLDRAMNGGDPARAVMDEKRREDRLRLLVKGFVRWEWADAVSTTRLAAILAAAGVLPVGR